ncbi:putative ATP-dependent RNA helicase DHX35 [Gonapodya prolifera JEL478]|uniref:RNA helicase n=1 Tax=Gonapodya prolifera (strain JEL478) TaxID=1344416 RepID=A0A139A7M2_GONPJ|nr:putative ATP-dependent RNA helicase DHX35 [Gonapodya prolifera JEL478]|eukprot:KXS12668.1 putative ATP-dependent RNA helicase DHX35 [Gonapodya prolifera JEL478]
MAFWKPGTIAPGSVVERDAQNELDSSILTTYNSFSRLSLQDQRQQLPIFANRNHILHLVETKRLLILVGQTGSGKTTQIPQYLHEAGWANAGRIVACTQPRRVAATTVAARVAQEMAVTLGEQVGYSVRFDEKWDPIRTRIKYLTDGMLLREMMVEPLLQQYSVVMVDEAHERSLNTDIVVGLLKKVMRKRQDLRVIVSSATLDAQQFRDFFISGETIAEEETAILTLDGRVFPVDVHFRLEPCSDYLLATVDAVVKIHTLEEVGDILVFLTGREEIERAVELIEQEAKNVRNIPLQLLALPLHGGMSMESQLRVFEPTPRNTRKVVLATNIAEASVTIDGIVYVVDSGFVKLRSYNPQTCTSSLVVHPISKAAAQQRAGRAGRTRAGKCFRLYTEAGYDTLRSTNVPEMQRSDLVPVALQLKALGVWNVLRFEFLSPPPAEMLARAFEILYSLNAVDDYGRLTIPYGMRLAELPIEPMMGAMLFNSVRFQCSEEIITIAAMLSVENIFVTQSGRRKEADFEKRKFSVEEGDHISYLNVYKTFLRQNQSPSFCRKHFLNYKALQKAVSVRNQLLRYIRQFSLSLTSSHDATTIRKCIASAYFSHAAMLQSDGTWRTLRGAGMSPVLHIHPNSVLLKMSPACVVYHEVVETTKSFMRDVTVIEPQWLPELAPHFYTKA